MTQDLIERLEKAEAGSREAGQVFGEAAEWPDMASWKTEVARRLDEAKERIDAGEAPPEGLRIMAGDSATVIPANPWGCVRPFAVFSLDSRQSDFYAVAQEAARDLVAYWREKHS